MNSDDVDVWSSAAARPDWPRCYLRRAGHRFVNLEDQPVPGGAWPHTWASLTLFSPAEYSSLPGWPMPNWPNGFPPARHVVDYLCAYEQRYELPTRRLSMSATSSATATTSM